MHTRLRLPALRLAGPGVALGLSVLAGGCGSDGASPAGGSEATPSPTPSVAPSGFAYVVDPQACAILAFDSDAVTGNLRLVQSVAVERAWAGFPTRIAADPRGRFVYAGLANPPAGGGAPTHTLRAFTVEGGTGRLLPAGQAPLVFPPVAVTATEAQVHVLGGVYTSGYIGSWDVFAVDAATGELLRTARPPQRFYPSFVAVDADGGVVYTVAAPSDADWPQEAMFASRWRDQRTLVDVDSIKLQKSTSDVALGASVSYTADESGRISWRSLDDRGQIHLLGRVDAFDGGPARLALGRPTTPRLSSTAPTPGMLIAVSSRTGLRLLEIGSAGEPTPRGAVDLPELETPRTLAFHPSGRYLYTSGEGEGLRVFRVGPDGTVLETARQPQGGGAIVLTSPPS